MSEKQAETKFNLYTKNIIKAVGDQALYTNQVDELGKKYFKNRFHGTYSSDKLPTLTAKQPYAIINVDSSKQPGSHWMAIAYCPIRLQTLVFDSFGRKTSILTPSIFKKYQTVDTDYDKNQLIRENSCGQKSVTFLRIFDKFGWDTAKLI